MSDEMVERSRAAVLSSLRERAAGVDLAERARALKADFDLASGALRVRLLDREFTVTPNLEIQAAEGQTTYEDQVIVLNALLRPGGEPGSGWAPFRELAAGHLHDFHEEAEVPLATAAEEICAAGEKVAQAVGGRVVEPVGGCDLCLEVPVFSGVTALVQVYREDMEFPAEGRMLFSAGSDRFLPPGCLEEVGRQLAGRIRRAAGA